MYKRWIAGMISFLVIWLVFLEPGCLAGEEISSFLTGEGSWELENIEAKSTVYQEFVPQYAHLKAVSVSFAQNTMGEEHYYINVGIMNEDREILAQKKVNSENLNEMAYTDFPISLTLKPGKTYYLFVEKDDIGEKGLVVNVCGKEYVIPENGNASWGEESLECQLLTSYVYEDAVTSKTKLIVILFGVLAGLGIAIGLPCAAFVLGVAAGFYLLDSGEILEKNCITYSSGFDQAFVYQINGYLASTVMDIKVSRIQKPEGYSQRRAQEILEEANKAADFVMWTVRIIIMRGKKWIPLRITEYCSMIISLEIEVFIENYSLLC